MNILDYIDWRGDLTFAERPFNEVDNLIFSELAYAEMKDIAPEKFLFTVSLKQLYDKYVALGYTSPLINDPLPLMEKTADCPRYRNVRIGGYVDKVDPARELQFSAVTFLLGDGTAYAAFRGTDNTIVGWREDFNLCFLPATPGQTEAAAYLNALAQATTVPLRVGGHSKGGNFAIYAAAFCDESLREMGRVVEVYSNDGPGFNSEIADSPRYKAVLPLVRKIIPESSLIGILLADRAARTVVKSDVKGLLQHDPFTWSVRGNYFVKADALSPESDFLYQALGKWVDSMNTDQKKAVVAAIFDSMEATGATTISEMNENKWLSYSTIGKALGSLDKDVSEEVTRSLRMLFDAGKDTLWDGAKKAWETVEKALREQSEQKKALKP